MRFDKLFPNFKISYFGSLNFQLLLIKTLLLILATKNTKKKKKKNQNIPDFHFFKIK